jgi:rhamnosyltransferase
MIEVSNRNNSKPLPAAQAAGTVLFKPDPQLLQQLLTPLIAEGCSIFIYINGPLEAAAEAILSANPALQLIRATDNVGQGTGLNALMSAAAKGGHNSIVLFDQDSTPEPSFTSRLSQRFLELDARPRSVRLAALGPLLVPPEGSEYLPIKYWRRSIGTGDPPGSVEFLPTSGTLISIAAWQDVGPFREDYFIGGIDVEWGFRAQSKGWSSIVADDIQMHHRWGEQRGNQHFVQSQFLRQPARRVYYYLRNAADGMKLPHMPWRWKWRQAARMTAQIGLGLVSKGDSSVSARLVWRALSDGYAGRLGPAPRGLDDPSKPAQPLTRS